MTQAKEIAIVSVQQQALERENVTEKVLREMERRAKGLTIKDVNDREGYNLVKGTRIECKKLRVLTTKICKAGREEAIQEQKRWIEAEKSVIARIEAVESPLQEEEARIDLLIEEAKRAKEQEVINKTRARVMAFAEVGMAVDYVDALNMTEEEYADTLESATAEYAIKQEQVRIEAELLAKETAERERFAAIEAERLAKEQDAFRKAKEEFEARRQKEQEELAEAQRKVREEQDMVRREIERQEQEKRHAEELAEAERKAALRAKEEAEAEAKRKDDARIAAEVAEQKRIAEEKAAAARKAAQAPDKEKLFLFAETINAIQPPLTLTSPAVDIVGNAMTLLHKVVAYINDNAEKL